MRNREAVIAARLKTFARVLREVEALEPVEAAAGSMVGPYDQGGWSSNMEIEGKPVEMEANFATVGFADVLGLELVAGRWFEEADEARAWTRSVIDQDLAREAYGNENPIGRQFGEGGAALKSRTVLSGWCASSARAENSRPRVISCSSSCRSRNPLSSSRG